MKRALGKEEGRKKNYARQQHENAWRKFLCFVLCLESRLVVRMTCCVYEVNFRLCKALDEALKNGPKSVVVAVQEQRFTGAQTAKRKSLKNRRQNDFGS